MNRFRRSDGSAVIAHMEIFRRRAVRETRGDCFFLFFSLIESPPFVKLIYYSG